MTGWDQADFDAAYQAGDGSPTYRRATMGPQPADVKRWKEIRRRIGIRQRTSLLVVGTGFGWSVEHLFDAGYHNIWLADPSPWIQTAKSTEARPDVAERILPIDVLDPDATEELAAAGAGYRGHFARIVTELTVETIPAGDLADFFDALEHLATPAGKILHVYAGEITPPGPGDIHDRTLGIRFRPAAEWEAERPAHHWLNIHDGIA